MIGLTLRSARAWLPALTALTAVAIGLPRGSMSAAQTRSGDDPRSAAAAFDQLLLHDPCTGDYPPQPDTCLHNRVVEKPFTFGGKPGVIHDVRLRIRGLFEPTTIEGGETPYPGPSVPQGGRHDQRAGVVGLAHRGLESPADVLAQSLSEGLTHDLRRGLRGDDSGGRRQRRGRSSRRWQRSADRQRQAGTARPQADHQGRRRSAPRRTDPASRRRRRHRPVTARPGSSGAAVTLFPHRVLSANEQRLIARVRYARERLVRDTYGTARRRASSGRRSSVADPHRARRPDRQRPGVVRLCGVRLLRRRHRPPVLPPLGRHGPAAAGVRGVRARLLRAPRRQPRARPRRRSHRPPGAAHALDCA